MVFIYILQLEQGKYYIGKTNNPTFRLENHYATTCYASKHIKGYYLK